MPKNGIIREERIGDCRLILGDCLEVMPEIGKVDAVVTSPPYDNLREYGEGFTGLDWRCAIERVVGVLKDGGVCMWNVADATVNGSETGTSFRQALYAIECGLNLHDTMIWVKQNPMPTNGNRCTQAFEYMFLFSKGAPKTVKIPKERSQRIVGGSTGQRAKDGKLKNFTSPGAAHENKSKTNLWVYPVGENRTPHPATFPYQLAADHILAWSNPSETILDPFMGSGTTLVACAKLGRKGIGIELDPDYFEIALKRVEEAYRQPDLFVEPPKPPKQEAMDI